MHHQITRFRPKLVVGYVSSLAEFSAFLTRRGLRIPPIEAVIAAAEPLDTPTRERISEALGAPMFNTYGCREFMSLAGECETHDGLHINVENILVETLSAASAGPSEVLVTDLHNYGMPFIRYAVGDLAVLDDSPCSCSRGLPKIQRIEGRVLDTLRTADGRTVPGEFFPHILKDIPEIAQYRVEQLALDHIVILAVLQSTLSDRSQGLLQREMARVFAEDTHWEVRPVVEIPRLASGKRRVTVGLRFLKREHLMGFFLFLLYLAASYIFPGELFPELGPYRITFWIGVLSLVVSVVTLAPFGKLTVRALPIGLVAGLILCMMLSEMWADSWMGAPLNVMQKFGPALTLFLLAIWNVTSLTRLRITAGVLVLLATILVGQGVAAYHFGFMQDKLLMHGNDVEEDDDASRRGRRSRPECARLGPSK